MRTFEVYKQSHNTYGEPFLRYVGLVNVGGQPGDLGGAEWAGREAQKVYAGVLTETFAVRYLSGGNGGITILRRVPPVAASVERVTI